MYRRIFSTAVILILILTILTGCTLDEAAPTMTLSPSPQPTPETTFEAPEPPAGTVAAVPTPTPEPKDETPPPPPQETISASEPLTVLSIIGGDVYVMKAGTDIWEPAEVGMTLESGDSIKAGSGSSAEITFFDGSTIELEDSTVIGISELGIADNGSTNIRLTQELGKTVSRVKKLADPASRYEIETPAAIAAVRGSTMEVTVEEDGTTTVGNLGGDIRIIVDGIEYIIREGYQRTIIPGYPPGPEVPIYIPPHEYQGSNGGGSSAVLTARIEVTITAEPSVAHIGETITYTYYLQNTGDLSLNNIAVDNDITGNVFYQSGDANSDSVLDKGETWVFTSTHVVSADDPSPLVATTTVSAMTFTLVTVIDTEIVSTPIVPISFTKTADLPAVHVGDNITYTFMITNYGETSLTDVTVSDDVVEGIDFISGDNNGNKLLDTGETWVFTATHTANTTDPDVLVNTAEVSAVDGQKQMVTASDNASVDILRPGISLTKTVNPTVVHEGDDITYTFTVTNTGNTPLSDVILTDDMVDAITYVSGDDNGDKILDMPEMWTFTAIYTTGPDDPETLVNNAEVSGMDALGLSVNATDSATVTVIKPFVPTPGINMVKEADSSQVYVGETITYTFTVTNTGNVPLSDVYIDDNMINDDILFVGGDDNSDGYLDVTETWIFRAFHEACYCDPNPLENIAEVYGLDGLGRTVSDADSASVTILR